MKKTLALIISLLLLFSVANTAFGNVFAEEASSATTDVISDHDAFYYYTAPDRSEFQLSQEQLHVSTDELIELVLNYPYLVDLYTSNSSTMDAYESLRGSFNALIELEKRADASSLMLARLEKTAASNNQSGMEQVYLQTLLSLPLYFNKLSATETASYIQLVDKLEVVAEISMTSSTENLVVNAGTYASSEIAFTVNGFSYARSSTNDYTTSGTLVPLYSATSDYTSAKKVSIAESTAEKYGIELLGNATSMYNCFSYAWYSASTSNQYWIANVYPYINDNHCNIISEPTVGSIAIYYDSSNSPVHAAIVTEINGGNVICKSKWGANGLFEHHIANVPSSYFNTNSSVKVAFYNYAHYHTCSVTIDNAVTHTRTCRVCGWTATEAHVADAKTGKCITCGLAGPFMTIINSIPEKVNAGNRYIDD